MVLYSFSTRPNFSIIRKPARDKLYDHHYHLNQHPPVPCDHCNHNHLLPPQCTESLCYYHHHLMVRMNLCDCCRVYYVLFLSITPSYLPLCYHSSKQMDKLKDRKESESIHQSNQSIFLFTCLFFTLFKYKVVLLTGSGSLAHKGNELFFYFLHRIQIIHKEDMSITGLTGYIHQFPVICIREANCEDDIAWERN